jgi:hypothetical protein
MITQIWKTWAATPRAAPAATRAVRTVAIQGRLNFTTLPWAGMNRRRSVEALVRAKQRGVDVRLIADKTTPCRCPNSLNGHRCGSIAAEYWGMRHEAPARRSPRSWQKALI